MLWLPAYWIMSFIDSVKPLVPKGTPVLAKVITGYVGIPIILCIPVAVGIGVWQGSVYMLDKLRLIDLCWILPVIALFIALFVELRKPWKHAT